MVPSARGGGKAGVWWRGIILILLLIVFLAK